MNVPTTEDRGPIAHVQQGMRVLDSSGDDIGTVDVVKMGDPDAVTTQGAQDSGGGGLWAAAVEALRGTEPDVPAPLAARMLRSGFIKVDSRGFLRSDVYVPADDIAGVEGETVRLAVDRDHLTKQA